MNAPSEDAFSEAMPSSWDVPSFAPVHESCTDIAVRLQEAQDELRNAALVLCTMRSKK